VRREVLNAVVIKGVAETAAVADATDLPPDEVGAVLAELAEAGLVRHRTGRLVGWSATAPGRTERSRLMREWRVDPAAEQPPEAAYHAFVAVNADLKRLCTDWQTMRAAAESSSGPAPGSASDVAPASASGAESGTPVDPDIAERLGTIHREVLQAVVEPFAKAQVRFAAYGRRLDGARRRFTAGDLAALTAPRQDSYHGVWMELHADILATLDRERTAVDGA
jgi:hypothetical protein